MTVLPPLRVCPVCGVRSGIDHKGDRHLVQCRYAGDNVWPGVLMPPSAVPGIARVSEPAVATVTEPVASGPICEKCGYTGEHTANACRQRRHRRRTAEGR